MSDPCLLLTLSLTFTLMSSFLTPAPLGTHAVGQWRGTLGQSVLSVDRSLWNAGVATETRPCVMLMECSGSQISPYGASPRREARCTEEGLKEDCSSALSL